MNQSWIRERELYNRAFGRFVSRIFFKPEDWLDEKDREEYIKLREEG